MWKNALIVGEPRETVETIAGVLKRFGFGAPDVVPDLGAAVERLNGAHYDLVLLPVHDIDQARASALERVIRQSPTTSFIGTAPESHPEVILRAMRSGVHEFLVSPPDPAELATSVDRLTRRHHAAPGTTEPSARIWQSRAAAE